MAKITTRAVPQRFIGFLAVAAIVIASLLAMELIRINQRLADLEFADQNSRHDAAVLQGQVNGLRACYDAAKTPPCNVEDYVSR